MDNKKPRVLLVDDDEESVRLLRSTLQAADFEVIASFDGLEGLDLATKHIPDVIITGIIMPRMTGFEMMRNLQSNVATAKIPVLVYSHLGREDDRIEAEKLGAREFLVRGLITPREIVEYAHKMIHRGKVFFLEFDPQKGDAKALQQAFNFKPYFECENGPRMALKLEAQESTSGAQEFRATFVCREKESKKEN